MSHSYDVRNKTAASKMIVVFTGFICAIVIAIYLLKLGSSSDKQFIDKCIQEKTLAFEGVVSVYQTDIPNEKSYFNLSDTVSIIIPRNSKEMFLRDNDTIFKKKGTNTYIIKRAILWNWQDKKSIDTFQFDCP